MSRGGTSSETSVPARGTAVCQLALDIFLFPGFSYTLQTRTNYEQRTTTPTLETSRTQQLQEKELDLLDIFESSDSVSPPIPMLHEAELNFPISSHGATCLGSHVDLSISGPTDRAMRVGSNDGNQVVPQAGPDSPTSLSSFDYEQLFANKSGLDVNFKEFSLIADLPPSAMEHEQCYPDSRPVDEDEGLVVAPPDDGGCATVGGVRKTSPAGKRARECKRRTREFSADEKRIIKLLGLSAEGVRDLPTEEYTRHISRLCPADQRSARDLRRTLKSRIYTRTSRNRDSCKKQSMEQVIAWYRQQYGVLRFIYQQTKGQEYLPAVACPTCAGADNVCETCRPSEFGAGL